MYRVPVVATSLLCTLFATGCMTGRIFTNVTTPVDVNFDRTPVFDAAAKDSSNTLQYYVQIDWGSTGMGDVAKKHGFSEIHYADLETLSILGIFTRRTLHVYGKR